MMKKANVRIISLCAAALVAAGSIGIAVSAGTSEGNVQEKEQQSASLSDGRIPDPESRQGLGTTDFFEGVWKREYGDDAMSREETVYVLTENDGSTKQIIVSDWVKDEQGKDLYYLGDMEKELPLSLAVSYRLDGEEILPQELAGKSGHVWIRYDYGSHQHSLEEVGDTQEEIYVPFMVITGMVLDNTQFHNISVSSGKVINDGTRTVVAGMAFPGLSRNLALEAEDADRLPDYLEVEADVTEFSLGNTYSIATNGLFSQLDPENLDGLEDLKEDMGKLTEAMGELMDGSSALYDGLAELYDKSGDLKSGAGQLADGAGSLREGAAALADGARTLQAGASSLAGGLDTLNSRSGELVNGAAQVFTSLLDMASSQLAASGVNVGTLTIDNYGTVLDGVLASLSADGIYNQVYAAVRAEVAAQVNANEPAIRAGVTQAYREQVLTAVLAGVGMDRAQYDALASGGTPGTVSGSDAGAALVAQIDAQVDAQMQSEDIQRGITEAVTAQVETLINENMAKPDIQNLISQKVAENAGAASGGVAKIAGLKAQLDSYNSFYQGLVAYTGGVAQASVGAGQLNGGAAQIVTGADALSAGAGELKSGTDTLSKGSVALVDGVSRLKDGAMQLRDGLVTFNEEGIEKLTSVLEDDLEEKLSRMRATVDASKKYHSFTEDAGELSGGVRFIFKTDAIGE